MWSGRVGYLSLFSLSSRSVLTFLDWVRTLRILGQMALCNLHPERVVVMPHKMSCSLSSVDGQSAMVPLLALNDHE